MDSKPSTAATKAPHNEPRDLQSRLYREIGISAVAAALEPATYPVENVLKPSVPARVVKHMPSVKAA